MLRRPPRSTPLYSSAASDVYKRQDFDHVHRDADRPGLVGKGTGDGLPDPPRRVGRELEALVMVELLDPAHEAHVAFLDEVEEGHAAADVLLGDRHDESQ